MKSCQVAELRYETFAMNAAIPTPVRRVWEYLVSRDTTAKIFSYPEWVSLASQAGVTSPWRLLVISHGDRPIGLLPLHKPSPWNAESIAPLSADHVSMLIDPRDAPLAFSGIAEWFRSQHAVRLLTIGPCGNAHYKTLFLQACRERQLATHEQAFPPSIWIPLPEQWEGYLEELGAATRKSIRTAEKRLTRDFPDLQCEILTTPGDAIDMALQELIRLYRLRWGNQVGGSYFHDARNVDFFLCVMQWALSRGYAAVPRLSVGGKTVAVSTILHVPGQDYAFFHLIARDMDALPSYYAPGIFINMHSIRWAMQQGIRQINIGSGKSDHKLLLGGTPEPIWGISVAHSAVALGLATRSSRALHVIRRLPVHLWYHLQQQGRKRSEKNGP